MKVHDIRRRDPIATFQNTYQITAVTFNDTADQVVGGGIDNDIKAIAFNILSPFLSVLREQE